MVREDFRASTDLGYMPFTFLSSPSVLSLPRFLGLTHVAHRRMTFFSVTDISIQVSDGAETK